MADVVNLQRLQMRFTKQPEPANQVTAVVVVDRSGNTGLGHVGLRLTVSHFLVRYRDRLQLDRFHLCQTERILLARRRQLRNTHPRGKRRFSWPI